MFCFSKTCRICKRYINPVTLTCNSQKEVSNVFSRVFPELMNSKLNCYLKNFCVSCETELLSLIKSLQKFKNRCVESDQCYMRYLKQLEGHDRRHAKLVCVLGIKQENCQNDNSQIQPSFDNYGIEGPSSYYGSAAQSSSAGEDIEKCEIYIKEENESAMVEEAISVLGWEESGSREIKDPLTLANQELVTPDYCSPIDEENVKANDNYIDGIQETIKYETLESSSNGGIENVSLRVIDSPVNTRIDNINIKLEYCQEKDDLKSIAEDDITKNDIVKHEAHIADKDASYNSIDSSINNNERQEIVGKEFFLNHHERKLSCMVEKFTQTDEKSYECDICKKTFPYKCSLTMHKRTHTGEKPFECDICNKSFLCKTNLTLHIRTHTGEKPFECDICKKSFSQKSSMIHHRISHTGEKPYECEVCNRSFTQKTHLKYHIKTHTGEVPFECDVCKKSFSHKSVLVKHKRLHTGEKPYECDICQMRFACTTYLTSHKRTHTGERPYECVICKKTFTQKSHMELHKRTHTGEKPYQCDVCEMRFRSKTALNLHVRTHTGEKPYECDVCKNRFSSISTLIKHKRTHTGEKPFECDVCNKSFASKFNLNAHKVKNHAVSSQQSLIKEEPCDSA